MEGVLANFDAAVSSTSATCSAVNPRAVGQRNEHTGALHCVSHKIFHAA